MRASKKTWFGGALALAATALLLVTAGGASSYPADSPEGHLAAARAELIALRGTLTTPAARSWLSRSVASLGWTIGAECWSDGGPWPTGPTAGRCFDAIRVTVRRLEAGDGSGELAKQAHPQILEIVNVVRGIALQALGMASSVPTLQWKIEHDIAAGDRSLSLDPRWALNDYLRAWYRWAGPPADAPAGTALGAGLLEPKLDYNPAGTAEAFEFQGGGSSL